MFICLEEGLCFACNVKKSLSLPWLLEGAALLSWSAWLCRVHNQTLFHLVLAGLGTFPVSLSPGSQSGGQPSAGGPAAPAERTARGQGIVISVSFQTYWSWKLTLLGRGGEEEGALGGPLLLPRPQAGSCMGNGAARIRPMPIWGSGACRLRTLTTRLPRQTVAAL